ncbi:MAG TPA: YgiT-type zinc finger protein [Methanosarcinaceae archaeon]|nr:YgiT-type zinc finger protein [Methanosarcinaceae archaeon]
MKCIICGSQDIQEKNVDEEIRFGNDIVMVNIDTLICGSCGERYYSRSTLKLLEEFEDKLKHDNLKLDVIGSVLRASNDLSKMATA